MKTTLLRLVRTDQLSVPHALSLLEEWAVDDEADPAPGGVPYLLAFYLPRPLVPALLPWLLMACTPNVTVPRILDAPGAPNSRAINLTKSFGKNRVLVYHTIFDSPVVRALINEWRTTHCNQGQTI